MSGLFAKLPTRSTIATSSLDEPAGWSHAASGVGTPGATLVKEPTSEGLYPNWPMHLRGNDPDDPKNDPIAHRVGRAVADTPVGIAKYFLDLPKRAIDASSKSFGPDGSYIPGNKELADLSAEVASNLVGGGAVRQFGRAAKAAESSAVGGNIRAASSTIDMFDPPPRPPRSFEVDYPRGTVAGEGGKLKYDVDGEPIVAPIVVGRRVRGGPDVPLTREETVIVMDAITGRGIEKKPESAFDSGTVGQTWFDPETRMPTGVDVLDSLDSDEYWKTVRHEFGHVIDQAAGEIEMAGLESELHFVYRSLQKIPEHPSFPITPEYLGYRPEAVPRELMAEAIRAYAIDPAYMKTVAPRTAAVIRKWVRASPLLSQTLQFNSIATGLITSAAALGALPRESRRPIGGQ